MLQKGCELGNHLALFGGQYLLLELLAFGGEDQDFFAGGTLLV